MIAILKIPFPTGTDQLAVLFNDVFFWKMTEYFEAIVLKVTSSCDGRILYNLEDIFFQKNAVAAIASESSYIKVNLHLFYSLLSENRQ
jgi:hypothetical protein